jgi:hypothetical protein
VCSGSAPHPVHRHRKEVEIDFEHGFVQAQTAPSYFVSVPSPSRQSPRVQRTFLSGQELRIARACFGFAQCLAHLYRPVQTQDPERSCRLRLTHQNPNLRILLEPAHDLQQPGIRRRSRTR